MEEATDAISMLIVHEAVRSSFKAGSKAELKKLGNKLTGTLGLICTVLLQSRTLNISLLSMGGNSWKDWVKN
jgi:hypothetical protein